MLSPVFCATHRSETGVLDLGVEVVLECALSHFLILAARRDDCHNVTKPDRGGTQVTSRLHVNSKRFWADILQTQVILILCDIFNSSDCH